MGPALRFGGPEGVWKAFEVSWGGGVWVRGWDGWVGAHHTLARELCHFFLHLLSLSLFCLWNQGRGVLLVVQVV